MVAGPVRGSGARAPAGRPPPRPRAPAPAAHAAPRPLPAAPGAPGAPGMPEIQQWTPWARWTLRAPVTPEAKAPPQDQPGCAPPPPRRSPGSPPPQGARAAAAVRLHPRTPACREGSLRSPGAPPPRPLHGRQAPAPTQAAVRTSSPSARASGLRHGDGSVVELLTADGRLHHEAAAGQHEDRDAVAVVVGRAGARVDGHRRRLGSEGEGAVREGVEGRLVLEEDQLVEGLSADRGAHRALADVAVADHRAAAVHLAAPIRAAEDQGALAHVREDGGSTSTLFQVCSYATGSLYG